MQHDDVLGCLQRFWAIIMFRPLGGPGGPQTKYYLDTWSPRSLGTGREPCTKESVDLYG